MNLIFLGPPGAGKGTQADMVCAKLNLAHISTGDMLRSEIKGATELGLAAKAYMDAGGLVPDDVIISMVEKRVGEDDCKNGFLLDGFPRTVAQADALGKFVDIDMVVNIDVPFEKLINRISGRRTCPKCSKTFHISSYGKDVCDCGTPLYQRDDDKPETVKNRLEVYKAKTQPLIDYYETKGLVKTVDGDKAVADVLTDIMALMGL